MSCRAAHTPNAPRRVRARSQQGVPVAVDGQRVQAVLESWLLEDRWWTGQPVRRRYWELVTVRGRNLVVFHDLQDDGWYTQAA
jgi:hypothetical protein